MRERKSHGENLTVFFEAELLFLVGDEAGNRSSHGDHDGSDDAGDHALGVACGETHGAS